MPIQHFGCDSRAIDRHQQSRSTGKRLPAAAAAAADDDGGHGLWGSMALLSMMSKWLLPACVVS